MFEKLAVYEWLGLLIPGILLIVWTRICFPAIASIVPEGSVDFPEAFAVAALVALAFLVGHLLQAVAAIAEPFLFKTFGGRPSDLAVEGKWTRQVPEELAADVAAKLRSRLGNEASSRRMFTYAAGLANGPSTSRVPTFNALYGFQRALLFLSIIGLAMLVCSRWWGMTQTWSLSSFLVGVLAFLVLIALGWERTKMRAGYYAREVLTVAEQVMDSVALEKAKKEG